MDDVEKLSYNTISLLLIKYSATKFIISASRFRKQLRKIQLLNILNDGIQSSELEELLLDRLPTIKVQFFE